MLKEPEIIVKKDSKLQQGKRPENKVIPSSCKKNTDGMGLCHICWSSNVCITPNVDSGFPICNNCKKEKK